MERMASTQKLQRGEDHVFSTQVVLVSTTTVSPNQVGENPEIFIMKKSHGTLCYSHEDRCGLWVHLCASSGPQWLRCWTKRTEEMAQ